MVDSKKYLKKNNVQKTTARKQKPYKKLEKRRLKANKV